MLKTYINTVPCTKFILITDSLENRDARLFEYILNQHLNQNHKIDYCIFEGVFKRVQDRFQTQPSVVLHDFVSHIESEENDFEKIATKLGQDCVIIIDSLAHAIFQYGVHGAYRIFNSLKNNKAIKQIVSVLHRDLIQGDFSQVGVYFANLSTLTISIQPKFMSDLSRVQYDYKKSGGKIISEVEEYRFEGEQLITNKIDKPDPSKLLEKAIPKEINPEELSTFRIGLTDEEKLSRDKLVLPYLPQANEESTQEDGTIFYQLDEVDDWDEEDPDDDLDI